MRIGPQVVVGTLGAAVVGLAALSRWKSRAIALDAENVDLRGRIRDMECERNSLRTSNDALRANVRDLSNEVAKLKGKGS